MTAVLQLASLLWAAFTLPGSLLLAGVAVTWQGRAFAAALMLAAVAALVGSFGREASRRSRRVVAITMAAASAVLMGVVIWRASATRPHQQATVMSVYARGDQPRLRLLNVVPEVDQLMAVFTAATVFDPLFTHEQAAVLKQHTRAIYAEMDRDAEFRDLRSMLPDVYAGILGARAPRHTYFYMPAALERTAPARALVFFHGSGGNFKAYLWLLRRLAEKHRLILIAPSCGIGDWTPIETRERLDGALAAIRRVVPIDSENVHVVGLSNGGLAVSHLLTESPAGFKSFVFLSPVFAREVLQTRSDLRGESKPPVLIATGRQDNRVPFEYVEDAARSLRRSGATVTLKVIDDADHFLWFTHAHYVEQALDEWLVGRPPSPSDAQDDGDATLERKSAPASSNGAF